MATTAEVRKALDILRRAGAVTPAPRGRFALLALLLASHALACLAGAYVAAKAAESAPADVCPVSAPVRASVWL